MPRVSPRAICLAVFCSDTSGSSKTSLREHSRNNSVSRTSIFDTLGSTTLVARLVPYETGMRFAAVPVCFHRDRVRVAFADPSDEAAQEAIKFSAFAVFDCAVSELSDIETALRTAHRTNLQF